jgi:glucokinase
LILINIQIKEQSNNAVILSSPPAIASRSTAREINRRSIMNIIYHNDGVSRAKLAEVMGLSKPAVSDCVADLISLGFVEEKHMGEASSNGGRRPVMLYFNGSRSYIGVVDLSLQKPVCAIGDLGFQLAGLKRIMIDREATADEKRQCVVETFKEILSAKNIPAQKMEHIIISHPGIIGNDNLPHFAEERHHAWTEIDLKSHLERHFDVPVLLENDVRLAALGEVHLGQDELQENIIYVKCGIGLGAGIIMDGKLYSGLHRSAGELGSFITSYGRRVEDVVAMEGLLRHIQELLHQVGRKSELCFAKVEEMVKGGDSLVKQGVRYIGQELGRTIYNASIMLDIPTVILGGDYLKLGDTLFDGIEEGMPQTFLARPKVFGSTLKESAGIFGGLVLGRNEIFMQKQLLSN